MKKVFLMLAVGFFVASCGNNADKEEGNTDTSNAVVLPEGRSSDSLAAPGATGSDTMRSMSDSAGLRRDSAR